MTVNNIGRVRDGLRKSEKFGMRERESRLPVVKTTCLDWHSEVDNLMTERDEETIMSFQNTDRHTC